MTDYAQPDIESMADMMTRQHPAFQRIKNAARKHIERGTKNAAKTISKFKLKSARGKSTRRGKAG